MNVVVIDVTLSVSLGLIGGFFGEPPGRDQPVALQAPATGAAHPRDREDVGDLASVKVFHLISTDHVISVLASRSSATSANVMCSYRRSIMVS